jgi:hypothetical protein
MAVSDVSVRRTPPKAHYGALLDTAAESMLARLEAGPHAQLMPETSESGAMP